MHQPLRRREHHAGPRSATRTPHRLEGDPRAAAAHLESLGQSLDTRSVLASHSIALQQLVAISRAMVLDAKVLILDEPTLEPRPRRGRAALRGDPLIFATRASRSSSSATSSTRVYEISDRITVLRNGKLIGEYPVADLPRGELVSRMIGRELDELDALATMSEREIDRSGVPTLRATGIGRRGALEPSPISRCSRARSSASPGSWAPAAPKLVRLVYGADRADSGQIELSGVAAKVSSPRHAIDRRVAFSSENRRAEGITADLSVAENIVLGIQACRGALRKVSRSEQDAVVSEYIEALGIRPADPDAIAETSRGAISRRCCWGGGWPPHPNC